MVLRAHHAHGAYYYQPRPHAGALPPPRVRNDSRRAGGEGRRCCASDPSTSAAAWGDKWDKDRLMELMRERRRQQQHPGAVAPPQSAPSAGPGRVYLVGTGPGDPGLLTLRALQLMRAADVVLYDRLVSDDVLRLIHPGAVMVYVGKAAGFHSARQEEIHELLLEFAQAGATVVRLKGGDPFVFGRGGEEVGYLAAHGIQVLAVPGVTAAAGICAELGIPMTHRGVATSVRFLTGHAREGGEGDIDVALTAGGGDLRNTTLVVYMGLGTLPGLVAKLGAAGACMDTPAVAVERGTTLEQRVVYGTLGQLAAAAAAAQLRSPTLIVIGEVVGLSPGWAAWRAVGAPLGAVSGCNGDAVVAGVACGTHPPAARLELPDVTDALLSGSLMEDGGIVLPSSSASSGGGSTRERRDCSRDAVSGGVLQ